MPVPDLSCCVFGQIKNKITRFRDDFADKGDTTITSRGKPNEGNGATPDQQTSSQLFRCPSCETVYIAHTKETCGTCGTDVSQVCATV